MKTISISLLSLGLVLTGCLKGENKNSHSKEGQSNAHAEQYDDKKAKNMNFWWPERLDLQPLRQHGQESNPLDKNFNYAKAFAKLNITEVKSDIEKIMLSSRDWWPADWGNYGPFFIRMAWHSAGTYRVTDGRGGAGGGQQRFEPLNSWPDNGNLDKARRLLWPVKKKYGKSLSWADLMVLAGNVAMESMGFKTLGFAGGRLDDWEADLVYWGPETKMIADSHKRYHKGKRKLKRPLGAAHMGLIYVNPEGPNGNHSPIDAASDIRETFGRMAMNDEETFALIAGGHTFGKAHGAHKPDECVGAEPAGAGIEEQGFGWKNKCGTGKGKDTTTSGLEGAWTAAPTKWTHLYLTNLMNFEWEKTKSPAGATQWKPKGDDLKDSVPDAHVKGKSHFPMMLTTDMALKVDPEYRKIAERFLKDPKEFEKAFAKAWFKLTHRDMGPQSRYVGSDAPSVTLIWQDPVPAVDHKLISSTDANKFKKKILKSGLSISDLVKTAWAAASSYRSTDMRGGANGARIRLEPQKNWAANDPAALSKVLSKLEGLQKDFNKGLVGGKKISLADTIVLAGAAGVEEAARKAGTPVKVDFKPGRTDASQEQTDIKSFARLETHADGFRNYYSKDSFLPPLQMLVDKANLLSLTVPEMTVLVGGMRVLGANSGDSKHGYFTDRLGTLSNDFFVNLMDMKYKWEKTDQDGVYKAVDRKSNQSVWTATPIDLIFGSHSELRAVSEVYAANDGAQKFANDFAKAWSKVMQLDRFDLK